MLSLVEIVKQVLLAAKILGRCYINAARPSMDTHDTNRLVAVTFEPEESPSPPQTPRRLRPAPQPREPSAVVAHKIQVEDDERDYQHKTTWRSCCLVLDKRATIFFSQLIFSLIIIGFCVGMLVQNQDCATFSRWSPLLVLVLGVWLPQPSLRGQD